MSDKQPEKEPTGESEYTGGWTKPTTVGGWEVPDQQREPQTGGWKRVRAMPGDLETTPTAEGAWHLPRPEDTPFSPEDELQITELGTTIRPEDVIFDNEEAEEDTAEALEDEEELEELVEDLETYSGLGELVATLSAVTDDQPAPSIVIGADEEDTAETQDADEESQELDFGAEREALSQAIAEGDEPTEMHPADQVRQPTANLVDLTDEDTADQEDPAAIARQRIAELQQGLDQPDDEAVLHDLTDTSAGDAADIARQRVAELSGEAPAEEDELTQRFRETQDRVRTLRQQYQNGEITRDALQEELRKYMVLDDNDVWWMMGVESDTWYRYDKNAGNWVIATPPVDLGAPERQGPAPTITTEFTPADVINGQLPYLPEDEDQAEPLSGDTEYTRSPTEPYVVDPDMPLPRAGTPIFDPDHTVPGRAAINQDTVRASEAETLEDAFNAGLTVPSQPVYEAAPGYATDETPLYDDLELGTDVYQQAVERQRQSTLRRILLITTLVIGSIFIIGSLLVLYVVVAYNNIASLYADEIANLVNYEPTFQTVNVLDANGELLTELNSQDGGRRVAIALSDMSPELIFAVVGNEDERYYENPGFNPLAIGGAFLQNLRGGQAASASDTITQQVASLVIPNQGTAPAEQSLHEIVIASEIARNYDKNFILELYMNEVFFGNQSYGVEAASEFYFEEAAGEANLAEGAMHASLINNPAITPVSQEVRDQSFENMDAVLRRLADVGCLNFQHPSNHPQYVEGQPFCIPETDIVESDGDFTAQINLQRAQIRGAEYEPIELDNDYPHFVQFVNDLMALEYGDEMFREGFTIETTLVPRISDVAQDALRQQLNNANVARGLQTGAIMVVDPTNGHIMAMIGSPDFGNEDIDGRVNNTLTWQQPGSAITPVVYTTAFEGVGDRNGNGGLDFNEYLTPATVLWDVPTQFQNPPYTPVTSNLGPVSARTALAGNLNTPAVKVYNFTGNERFVDTARRMGLTFLDDAQFGLPTADGATDVRLIDMMQAYSVLANTGQMVPLRAITRITDADGNEVPLQGRLAPVAPAPVIPPNVTFLIQNILADNNARSETLGANTPLFFPEFPDAIAAKTGTSGEARDVWTMGFSRNTVVGVWMGRPNNGPTQAISMEAAAPVFNAVMRAALEGRQRPGGFGAPGNTVASGSVVTETICNYTGARPTDSCTERRNELFAADRLPPPPEQGAVVNIAIDTWTGLRANQICPDNVQTMTFVNLFPSDPWALQWLASPQGQPTARRMGLPFPPQPPPEGECSVNNVLPTARITSPTDGQTVSETVQITGAVAAPNFDRYQIELAPINTGDFTIIAGPFQTQQPTLGSVLAEWDSRTVNNGQYTLRLSMFATAASGGGFLNREVRLNVQNIPPTPTPSPTAPPTVASPTTIPFPTSVFPTQAGQQTFPSQGIGDPTATATITIGN